MDGREEPTPTGPCIPCCSPWSPTASTQNQLLLGVLCGVVLVIAALLGGIFHDVGRTMMDRSLDGYREAKAKMKRDQEHWTEGQSCSWGVIPVQSNLAYRVY